MLTTTEIPTFFGPFDSPLFGVLHLPGDRQIRGGVVICGSLGKEGMDSVRLHRITADNLARRGFAALHFDYLGLGNSAYSQVRDDAVANWVASVGHALAYLRLIGAKSLSAIGIRAGCLILEQYLAQSRSVKHVVYLDPPGTGRRYLREHTTLYKVSLGEDAATPGEVTIMGGRLSDRAAAEFAALRLGTNPVSGYGVDKMLVVGRPAETDQRITALASAEGVDSITTLGLAGCSRPRDIWLPVPFGAVDSISGWIDENVGTGTNLCAPQYITTATIPAEGPDDVDVVESIERIEPNGLFLIRTSPQRRNPTAAKTVLFFVTANDLHVGPVREWVELSRRVAAAGSQAVRWDPAGLGLSGQISREFWRRVYSKADIADSIAVARHACPDAGRLELVGICSGSWYAAQVARGIGTRSAILVNLLVWNWRITPTLLSQRYVRRRAVQANVATQAVGGTSEIRTRRVKAHLYRGRALARSFVHTGLPRYVLRVLNWLGLVYRPEDVLTALAHRGTNVTLIVSPEDLDVFASKGGRAALDRLKRSSRPPRLIATPTGDHSAHHPAILAAIRGAVLPLAAATRSSPARDPQVKGVGA